MYLFTFIEPFVLRLILHVAVIPRSERKHILFNLNTKEASLLNGLNRFYACAACSLGSAVVHKHIIYSVRVLGPQRDFNA